jgi:predicted transcriptional regulator
MKIERIRRVFDVTQAELASFMGLSRSFISMNERKQRTFSARDNHRIDTMYEAVFREPEQHALTAIQKLQSEYQDAIQVDIKRQLSGFQQKVQYKEMEMERAQKHYQNLQSRMLAILHLEEALKHFESDLNGSKSRS